MNEELKRCECCDEKIMDWEKTITIHKNCLTEMDSYQEIADENLSLKEEAKKSDRQVDLYQEGMGNMEMKNERLGDLLQEIEDYIDSAKSLSKKELRKLIKTSKEFID